MPYQITTPPTVEPVSLRDAKRHCRVDFDDDDAYVEGLIVAARSHVEGICHRGLVTQTVTLTADAFPRVCGIDGWYEFDGRRHRLGTGGPAIPLPWGRVQSATSVAYVDTNGDTQTLAADAYRVDAASEPGRITPAYGTCWPCTRCVTNAVTVEYVTGYGDAATDVPQPVRSAMLLLIGHWYQNREAVNVGNIVTPMDFAVEALLAPYRIMGG